MIHSLSRRLKLRPGLVPTGFSDLAHGSFWLILAAVLGQGSMLVANLLVANVLGVSDYGRYALLQSSITMLALLAQLGLGVIIAQQVAKYSVQRPSMAGEIAAFCFLVTGIASLVLGGALLAGRNVIAEGILGDRGLAVGLAWAALGLPWFAAAVVQQGLLNGLGRFRDQATISIVLSPLVVLLPSLCAYQAGVQGGMIGLGFVYLIRAAFSQFMVGRAFRSLGIAWTLRNVREKMFLLWHYALPATLAGILVALALWGGQTLLLRSEGGATTLGLFAAAYTIKTIVMFIPAQMVGALLPVLTRHRVEGEGRGRHTLLYMNVGLSVAITLSMAATGILLAPRLFGLFGPGFAAGYGVLVVLLLGTPLEAATITLYQEVQSRGHFWRSSLGINLPLAAMVLFGAATLVPHYHAQGLAFAWLCGWGVALAATVIIVARHR